MEFFMFFSLFIVENVKHSKYNVHVRFYSNFRTNCCLFNEHHTVSDMLREKHYHDHKTFLCYSN